MPEGVYPLARLACPLGMGVMMWMMMRSGNQAQPADAKRAELAGLQAQIDQMQADQRERDRTGTHTDATGRQSR